MVRFLGKFYLFARFKECLVRRFLVSFLYDDVLVFPALLAELMQSYLMTDMRE